MVRGTQEMGEKGEGNQRTRLMPGLHCSPEKNYSFCPGMPSLSSLPLNPRRVLPPPPSATNTKQVLGPVLCKEWEAAGRDAGLGAEPDLGRRL